MRKLVYVFTDGSETVNYAEALASAMKFKAEVRDVIEPAPALTGIRKAYMETYGRVDPAKLKAFADAYKLNH